MVLDAKRISVELGGRTLREPFHVVVTGLHIDKNGGVHSVLCGIFTHNGSCRLVLDLIGDVGHHLALSVQYAQFHIRTRATATAECHLGIKTIALVTIQGILLHRIATGGFYAEAIITAYLRRLDVARRIARQSRHHTRVDEGFTVFFINLVGCTVEKRLEIGSVFNSSCTCVFHGDARHDLRTAKVRGHVVGVYRKIRIQIDLGIYRKKRRDFLIGTLVA